MLEVNVEHLGAVQFDVKARQHSIVSDQPEDGGGFDEGMTPPELMLAALGSCAAYYAAAYLKRKNLSEAGTHVRVTAEKVSAPMRLDNFSIAVDVPIDLTEEHRAGLEDAVHRCLIHNTLLHPPAIAIQISAVAVVR